MNRPPQKADWWFEKHQKECGGTYHLIKSPENPSTEKKVVTVDSLFKKCGMAHKLGDKYSVCSFALPLDDKRERTNHY